MIVKPLYSLLVCIGSTLMLAGTAQAQSLFGNPFFGPYYPQPRYSSPCGPSGCPTNVTYGYAPRTNCPGGVCNGLSNGYSANYAPRGYGNTNGVCGPNGCSTGSCSNGNCSSGCPNGQCIPNTGGNRSMPYPYDMPARSLPMPPVPQGGYNTNRPAYYGDELPVRVAPPAYLDPRSNPYYGASRGNRYDTARVDRSRSRIDADRSPFYP